MSRHNSSDWSCPSFVKSFSSHSKPSLSQVFSSPRVRSALVRQAHKKAWAGVVAAVVDGKPSGVHFDVTAEETNALSHFLSESFDTVTRKCQMWIWAIQFFDPNNFKRKWLLLQGSTVDGWYLVCTSWSIFYTGNYRMKTSHMMQDYSHELWETLLDFQRSPTQVLRVHVCKKAPASVQSDVWGGWQYQESRLLFKTKMVGCHLDWFAKLGFVRSMSLYGCVDWWKTSQNKDNQRQHLANIVYI